jgi:hypothetical protein
MWWGSILSITWAVMLCASSQGSQAAELPGVLVTIDVEVATTAQPMDEPLQPTDVDADGGTKAYTAEQLPSANSERRYSTTVHLLDPSAAGPSTCSRRLAHS